MLKIKDKYKHIYREFLKIYKYNKYIEMHRGEIDNVLLLSTLFFFGYISHKDITFLSFYLLFVKTTQEDHPSVIFLDDDHNRWLSVGSNALYGWHKKSFILLSFMSTCHDYSCLSSYSTSFYIHFSVLNTTTFLRNFAWNVVSKPRHDLPLKL